VKEANPRNTSGFPGVSWHEGDRKWQARINVGRRHIHLGYFDIREEAHAAYLAAKAILHPFAPTPRGVPLPDLHSFDRMRAAQRVIKASRRFDDRALELDAWEHLIAAW
jgi:AP2 domain